MAAPTPSRDLDRLYWLLRMVGPLTMKEICIRTNWTQYRANQRLYQLQRYDCVRLIERGQHAERHPYCGYNHYCGKWEAIAEPKTVVKRKYQPKAEKSEIVNKALAVATSAKEAHRKG